METKILLNTKTKPSAKMLTPAVKSGRAWNGFHNDSGTIVHAVEPLPPSVGGAWFTPAVCGTTPARRGNGWAVTPHAINCPKCLKKLST